MITISRYFPASCNAPAEYRMKTVCETPEQTFNSECYRGRVKDHKLEYWFGDIVTCTMIFFDNGRASIIVQTDKVQEMIAFMKLAKIEPGIW